MFDIRMWMNLNLYTYFLNVKININLDGTLFRYLFFFGFALCFGLTLPPLSTHPIFNCSALVIFLSKLAYTTYLRGVLFCLWSFVKTRYLLLQSSFFMNKIFPTVSFFHNVYLNLYRGIESNSLIIIIL